MFLPDERFMRCFDFFYFVAWFIGTLLNLLTMHFIFHRHAEVPATSRYLQLHTVIGMQMIITAIQLMKPIVVADVPALILLNDNITASLLSSYVSLYLLGLFYMFMCFLFSGVYRLQRSHRTRCWRCFARLLWSLAIVFVVWLLIFTVVLSCAMTDQKAYILDKEIICYNVTEICNFKNPVVPVLSPFIHDLLNFVWRYNLGVLALVLFCITMAIYDYHKMHSVPTRVTWEINTLYLVQVVLMAFFLMIPYGFNVTTYLGLTRDNFSSFISSMTAFFSLIHSIANASSILWISADYRKLIYDWITGRREIVVIFAELPGHEDDPGDMIEDLENPFFFPIERPVENVAFNK